VIEDVELRQFNSFYKERFGVKKELFEKTIFMLVQFSDMKTSQIAFMLKVNKDNIPVYANRGRELCRIVEPQRLKRMEQHLAHPRVAIVGSYELRQIIAEQATAVRPN